MKQQHIDWANAGLKHEAENLRKHARNSRKRFANSHHSLSGFKEASEYAAQIYIEAAELIEARIKEPATGTGSGG